MNKVYLANSKEWYEETEQAKSYIDLLSRDYGSGIIQSEDLLLRKNLDSLINRLTSKVHYIDLGPGNGEKTLFLCRALHSRDRLYKYTAVDIQSAFLKISERVEQECKVPIQTFNSSFEDFLDKVQVNGPKFIYLGATYGNFEVGDIERRLQKFMGDDDLTYLSSGLRPSDLDSLILRYNDSLTMFKPLIMKYNLPQGGELKSVFCEESSSIEQVYQCGDTTYVLGISRKHSIESFREQVSKYFEGDYFVEDSHIGFFGGKRKNG